MSSRTTLRTTPSCATWLRRFAVAACLGVPLVLLSMGPMLGLPVERWLAAPARGWLELALATPALAWAGWPFFQRGARSLVGWKLNRFTLISLGTATAYLYSVTAVIAPDLFPVSAARDGHIGLYFEAAVVIIALVALGQVLELRADRRTGAAIRSLLSLAPSTARVERGGVEREVALADVAVGDVLSVRPGDKIPVDGSVIEGRSHVDEAVSGLRHHAGPDARGRGHERELGVGDLERAAPASGAAGHRWPARSELNARPRAGDVLLGSVARRPGERRAPKTACNRPRKGEATVLYMLLIASDPTQPPREGVIDEHFAFAREARQRGAYVTSEALMEPDTATTVRVREGRTLTIDGPFAETKEVLGGYYLLDCKDLDEAIELAAKLPAAKDGAVEIRPIRNIPGWEYTLVPERRN